MAKSMRNYNLTTSKTIYGNFYTHIKDHADIDSLTTREIDILCFWIRGYSAKGIGKKLNISYRTVETHIRNISIKLKCRCKIQLLKKIQDANVDIYIEQIFLAINSQAYSI